MRFGSAAAHVPTIVQMSKKSHDLCIIFFKSIDFFRHSKFLFQVNYCSQECRSDDFDSFHWAECGFVNDLLEDESLGRLALLVYRIMVKSGLEKCSDTHQADLALTEKNCSYDSQDYASVYLQVIYGHLMKIQTIKAIRRYTNVACRTKIIFLLHCLTIVGSISLDQVL